MGLYDREYAHRGRGGFEGGFGSGIGSRGPRGWTANAWIIAICIGVFMIDALMGPAVSVPMGTVIDRSAPPEVVDRAERVEREVPSTLPGTTAYPLVDEETGTVVGQQRYLQAPLFQAIGHFSTGKGFFELEVWRLIGFQFLHANLSHLFMNMLGLFFFGPIVESRLGRRKYVAFYLICGIAGAIMYLLLNGLGQMGLNLPGVLINDLYTPLIGASAGVFGVLMASAYLAPRSTVLLFFIIPAPLKVVVYGFVALAAFNLLAGGSNAGGDAAHLGGAIAGAFFVRKPELLRDFLDFTGRGVASKKRKPRRARASRGGPSEAEVDRILSKVATEGLTSLSDRERKILKKASEAKGG
jgi:membrane associated rhomboid family serine protease